MNINDTVYIKSTTGRDPAGTDLSYLLKQARDNRTPLRVVKVDESATPFQVVAELQLEDDPAMMDNNIIRVRFALSELEPAETLDSAVNQGWTAAETIDELRRQNAMLHNIVAGLRDSLSQAERELVRLHHRPAARR
jgi:hypothetical protein